MATAISAAEFPRANARCHIDRRMEVAAGLRAHVRLEKRERWKCGDGNGTLPMLMLQVLHDQGVQRHSLIQR